MRPDMLSQILRFGVIGFLLVGIAVAGGLMLRSATAWRGDLEAALFDPPRTLAEADAASRESGKPALLFVQATWCPHCSALRKGAFRDQQLLEELREGTIPALVTLQSRTIDPEELEALDRLKVNQVPTLILRESGREVGRLTGVYDAEAIRSWLRSGGTEQPGVSQRVSPDLR